MEMKDYNLTCGEVIDNLLTLADAYEKASAGKAPNGFAFNPTDAAANMKAAVHFIGSFGQQLPRWIPVAERMPDAGGVFPYVLATIAGMFYPVIARRSETSSGWIELGDQRMFAAWEITHWMNLPASPTDAK
jgi:hypothetical protein